MGVGNEPDAQTMDDFVDSLENDTYYGESSNESKHTLLEIEIGKVKNRPTVKSFYETFGHGLKYAGITGRMLSNTGIATYLQNTLEAILSAKLAGGWGVELDIKRSFDNVPVVCHSTEITIGETTQAIELFTLAQLQTYVNPASTTLGYNITIPTLAEALEKCREYNLIPLLDLKYSDGLVSRILDVVYSYNMQESVIILSDYIKYLQDLRTLDRKNMGRYKNSYCVNYRRRRHSKRVYAWTKCHNYARGIRCRIRNTPYCL